MLIDIDTSVVVTHCISPHSKQLEVIRMLLQCRPSAFFHLPLSPAALYKQCYLTAYTCMSSLHSLTNIHPVIYSRNLYYPCIAYFYRFLCWSNCTPEQRVFFSTFCLLPLPIHFRKWVLNGKKGEVWLFQELIDMQMETEARMNHHCLATRQSADQTTILLTLVSMKNDFLIIISAWFVWGTISIK